MGSGKKKIEIKKIEKESRRMVTFSKRRRGLFKKADELRCKTGANVAILVISASGKPYPYGDLDAIDAILNACLKSDLNVHNSSSNGTEDVIFRGNNLGLRQWLDEINVEGCNDLEQLMILKKQLEEAKETMIRTKVESWTL